MAITAAVMTVGMLLQLAAYEFIEVAYVEAIKRSMGLIGSVAVGLAVLPRTQLAAPTGRQRDGRWYLPNPLLQPPKAQSWFFVRRCQGEASLRRVPVFLREGATLFSQIKAPAVLGQAVEAEAGAPECRELLTCRHLQSFQASIHICVQLSAAPFLHTLQLVLFL